MSSGENPRLKRSVAEERVKKAVNHLVEVAKLYDIYFKEEAVERIRDIVWRELEMYFAIYDG